MTLSYSSSLTPRAVGLAGSIGVHIAIGIALLLSRPAHTGGTGKQGNHGDQVLVIEMIPLPAGGSTAARGAPEKPAANSGAEGSARAREDHAISAEAGQRGSGTPAEGEPTANDKSGRFANDGPHPGAPTLSGAELESFRLQLLRHIEKFRRYPEEARRRAIEGITQVHFVMGQDGTVSSIWVEMSSGSDLLDDATVAAVKRAQPLPAPPASWPGSIAVTLPIGYALK